MYVGGTMLSGLGEEQRKHTWTDGAGATVGDRLVSCGGRGTAQEGRLLPQLIAGLCWPDAGGLSRDGRETFHVCESGSMLDEKLGW